MIIKNKFMKLSLCVILAGIILTSIGYAFGGAKYTINNFKVKPYLLNNFKENFESDNICDDLEDTNKDDSRNNNSNDIINDAKELDEFDDIDLSVDVGSVKIIKGDKYKIEAKYYKDRDDLTYSVENKKLIVKSKNHSNGVNCGFNETNKNLELTITMANLIPTKINAIITTGKLELNNLNLQNSYIENTTGQICGTNLISNNLEAENTTGEIIIDGELKGKNKITCVTGNINLTSTLKKDDYTYDASIVTGSGKIDGRKYKDVVNEKNNNAKNSFKIECTTGNFTVDFK